MTNEALYVARFRYPSGWAAHLGGGERRWFFVAEGKAEGRINGRLVGANHPRQRPDGTFEPDFQGVIETGDGASVLFDYRGYGRAYPAGRRQIVGCAQHWCDDQRLTWLNDAVCTMTGEVRTADAGSELVIVVTPLDWTPPPA
jgi:hypothetical protein